MATCTVTFTVNEMAKSEAVIFRPFPFQVIGGIALSTAPIYATASGTSYTAALVQGAIYVIESALYPFIISTFKVPAAGTANLIDLLQGVRQG